MCFYCSNVQSVVDNQKYCFCKRKEIMRNKKKKSDGISFEFLIYSSHSVGVGSPTVFRLLPVCNTDSVYTGRRDVVRNFVCISVSFYLFVPLSIYLSFPLSLSLSLCGRLIVYFMWCWCLFVSLWYLICECLAFYLLFKLSPIASQILHFSIPLAVTVGWSVGCSFVQSVGLCLLLGLLLRVCVCVCYGICVFVWLSFLRQCVNHNVVSNI